MQDSPETPAPGWYPTPEGGQQFWDGSKWLALPAPVASAEVSAKQSRWRPSRRVVLIAGAVLIVLAASATTIKMTNDSRVASEQQAAEEVARVAAEQAAKAEADRVAEVIASQERADASERASRVISVLGVEESVKTMAIGHADKGTIKGPIISSSCSPVSGGSTDDLTEVTTVFECFVANKDNGDGTLSGYHYHATMNWDAGTYTYGFGSP